MSVRRPAILACCLALGTVASFAADVPQGPSEAAADLAPRLVPQSKLVKAVRARDAYRSQAKALRQTLEHSPSVDEAKALAVVLYGVPRRELDFTVRCESTDNPRARNGQYRGNLQLGPIFEGTPFAHLDVFSPYVNILAGAYIWRTGGRSWAPWECSKNGPFQP